MKDKKFTLIDENGVKTTYSVLFTFENEKTGKNYIAYTDNSKDKDGNIQIYASIYNPNDSTAKLEEIKTEEEWKVIDTIIKTLQDELKKGSEA